MNAGDDGLYSEEDLEKIKDVLPKLKNKIIMDDEATKPLPLLDLNNALNGKGATR